MATRDAETAHATHFSGIIAAGSFLAIAVMSAGADPSNTHVTNAVFCFTVSLIISIALYMYTKLDVDQRLSKVISAANEQWWLWSVQILLCVTLFAFFWAISELITYFSPASGYFFLFVILVVVFALVALSVLTVKKVSLVSFNYSGSVGSSVDPTIKAGDTIDGEVVYDDTLAGSGGAYIFTNSPKQHTFNLKDYRAGVLITSDSFAGGAAAYEIQIDDTRGTFTLTGKTAARRNFELVMTYNGTLGNNNLPTSMTNWNTNSVTVNFT
jgi:hypothetical protein